jgi:hypothetical protein
MDHSSLKRKYFLTLGLPLVASGVISCGSKTNSQSIEEEKKEVKEEKKPNEPGVSGNTNNNLVVTGQLAITGTSLADPMRSIVMYAIDNQGNVVNKKLIDVDPDGKFSTDIGRSQLEKIESAFSDKGIDRSKLKDLFPEHGSKIDQMPDEEIRKEFNEEIKKRKQNPDLRYVLVSYVKSGKPEE